MTLHDIMAPEAPRGVRFPVVTRGGDIATPGEAATLVDDAPGVVFHLAAVVSGEAEADFDKGYRVNVHGMWNLLEAVRAKGHKPRLVFTSSIAVFGGDLPDPIPDDFHQTPPNSYGTAKVICEHPAGICRRNRPALPRHHGAAGQAQQGGERLLFFHHPRAARRAGGNPSGTGLKAKHARESTCGDRISHACGRA
jgi:hypothetical protein